MIEQTFDGTLGFFWPSDGSPIDIDGDEAETGWIKLEGPWAIVDALEEDVIRAAMKSTSTIPPLEAIVAVLASTSALLLEVQPFGTTTNIGGLRASSSRYRARVCRGVW